MERNARTEAVRIDDLPGVRHDGGEEAAPVVPPPLPSGSPSREDVLGRQISAGRRPGPRAMVICPLHPRFVTPPRLSEGHADGQGNPAGRCGVCTAVAPVFPPKEARSTQTAGFAARLSFRMARRPGWLLGIASMIGGLISGRKTMYPHPYITNAGNARNQT